jgi:hypothetical protein
MKNIIYGNKTIRLTLLNIQLSKPGIWARIRELLASWALRMGMGMLRNLPLDSQIWVLAPMADPILELLFPMLSVGRMTAKGQRHLSIVTTLPKEWGKMLHRAKNSKSCVRLRKKRSTTSG